MSSTKRTHLLMIISVFVSLVVGVAIGLIWQFQTVKRACRDNWAATISTNISSIRLIQEGNTDEAIKKLEQPLANSVLQLGSAFGSKPESLPSPQHIGTLRMAKAYQQDFPSWNPSQEVLSVLEQTP